MRVAIGIGLLIMAIALLGEAVFGLLPQRISDLFLNLGTELIGIVLTVAIIDHLFERRRENEESRRIAKEALHELDHHVWVWLGGAREFDLAELTALLAQASDDDPVPDFTQNLFLQLGSRASNTLRTRADIVRRSPALGAGLSELAKLERMRDADTHLRPSAIAGHIASAVTHLTLAAALTQPPAVPLAPKEFRETSIPDQEWRHFGRRRGA
jgi:hypothetical protein